MTVIQDSLFSLLVHWFILTPLLISSPYNGCTYCMLILKCSPPGYTILLKYRLISVCLLWHLYPDVCNRHLRHSMSNTELYSTTQNSASPTNFFISVDENSIFPEVQNSNSSTASSFTLSHSQSSCGILEGTIWSDLFNPAFSLTPLVYWLCAYQTDFITI